MYVCAQTWQSEDNVRALFLFLSCGVLEMDGTQVVCFMCMSFAFMYVCMCTIPSCMPNALRSQKSAANTLELQLEMTVSHPCWCWELNQVFYKSNKCSLLVSHPSNSWELILRVKKMNIYNSNGFSALKMVSPPSEMIYSIAELRNLRWDYEFAVSLDYIMKYYLEGGEGVQRVGGRSRGSGRGREKESSK